MGRENLRGRSLWARAISGVSTSPRLTAWAAVGHRQQLVPAPQSRRPRLDIASRGTSRLERREVVTCEQRFASRPTVPGACRCRSARSGETAFQVGRVGVAHEVPLCLQGGLPARLGRRLLWYKGAMTAAAFRCAAPRTGPRHRPLEHGSTGGQQHSRQRDLRPAVGRGRAAREPRARWRCCWPAAAWRVIIACYAEVASQFSETGGHVSVPAARVRSLRGRAGRRG